MVNDRVEAATAEPGGGVQSVDRAITVLEIVARNDGAGVGEVALELGVHKSTASRLLSALEERDLVEADGERGRYRLGFGLLRLAGRAVGRLDLARQADAVLQDFATTVGETVNLAVLRGHFVVNVADARGPAAIAAQNWVGRLTPLHATSSGKILLAHQSPAARKQLLDAAGLARHTPHTVTSRRLLGEQLSQALTAGIATSFEEYELGLNAVAAPVQGHAGTVVAAVSVSGPAYRLDADRVRAITPVLARAAADISARMGHLD
ncbi:transcriptional regulator, IclR family [Jatrophihabitans endophyticus]|uniref:Glycerol operon regulatory protein n=1 Tax=Jatrophihabitans endophyticus TaxID=1206085 RepID=A0A1M5CF77_9ACTN|nr:IclR family transcriptional regulator [Jatrophihabitans endophyticus]SHF53424.1 transcriptional regulator, IclR family [Jatrophihabitans endophyticus]